LTDLWRQNHEITDPMTSKSWNNIKIFMLDHGFKCSLFLSWLLHENIKGNMRIYVTTSVILELRWHIVLRPHLIALNHKLNDFFNKILCCKKSSIPVHSWLLLRLVPIMIDLIAGWYQQGNYCVTNYHEYLPLVVSTSRSFPRSRLITGFVTRLTRRVPLVG
jgi:hypothetical protein